MLSRRNTQKEFFLNPFKFFGLFIFQICSIKLKNKIHGKTNQYQHNRTTGIQSGYQIFQRGGAGQFQTFCTITHNYEINFWFP